MRIDVGRENSTVIELQVDDLGFGPPVLLLHGWPLSSRVWAPQLPALLAAGRRVITVDRRGFGRSTRCSQGFDLDTLADDLKCVLDRLDLADAVVVAHDLGAAELLRYLGSFGGERLRAAVLVAPPPPAPPTDGLVLPAVEHAAALRRWIDEACAPDTLAPDRRLGADARHALWLDAVDHGIVALQEGLAALQAVDLRDDLPRIGLPVLVLQGGADRRWPAGSAAEPVAEAIAGARLQRIDGAPHGLLWTHADEVNAALLAFLRDAAA